MSDAEFPAEFWQGIEQFNAREFYPCHDTLEAIWLECYDGNKQLYQGILQIAVACYHLSNHNWRGCAILLGEGMSRLNKYPGDYGGLDLDTLIDTSTDMLSAVQQRGETDVAALAAEYGLNEDSEADGESTLEVRRNLPHVARVSE
ncbi:MAG: DUF309 domain-containing protein [Geitlerinemataceae cyanobacterium]